MINQKETQDFIEHCKTIDKNEHDKISLAIGRVLWKGMSSHNANICSSLFQFADPNDFSVDANIAFLTFSLISKETYIGRDKFYDSFEAKMIVEIGEKDTEKLLRGLK